MICAQQPADGAFVITLKERCRVCYTCVRECPAKAIKIADGQAQVIGERCIACGNCVRVCSQDAKQAVDTTRGVEVLLQSQERVAAILAPSFPAEFTDIDANQLVGMLHQVGFDRSVRKIFSADAFGRPTTW